MQFRSRGLREITRRQVLADLEPDLTVSEDGAVVRPKSGGETWKLHRCNFQGMGGVGPGGPNVADEIGRAHV